MAFHTHQIVAIFHIVKVRVAQPIIAKVSFHEPLYCALTSSNGNNPTNRVMQLAPSQGIDNSTADAKQSAIFVFVENCRLNCIIMQIYKKSVTIVMIDSFCTSRRIAKCSHRQTMLRFCSLAKQKNYLPLSTHYSLKKFSVFRFFIIFVGQILLCKKYGIYLSFTLPWGDCF